MAQPALLQQLLEEIRSGNAPELKSLAARLHTTPQMVEAMLEHLQRSGHLRLYAPCDTGCQGCGLQSGCRAERPQPRLWVWKGKAEA